MIWDSIAIMTIIDLAIISLAIFVTFTFCKYSQVLKKLKLYFGINLILSGLLLIALFYLADLTTMFVLPMFVPMKKAMKIMSDLHLQYNWIVSVVAVSLIVIGLIYLMKYMIPKINMLIEEDISKRKKVEMEREQLNVELDQRNKELEHMAYYDHLTQIPNRVNFLSHIKRLIQRTKHQSDYMFAVLFIDLDRFKIINDSLGHEIGDELLVVIAHRLEAFIRPTDTVSHVEKHNIVARFGGDEFAVILLDVKDISSASRVADRLQAELQEPILIGKHKLYISASMGIALSAAGYENAEDMLRDADSAMYRAKDTGKSHAEIFDEEMHVRVTEALELESALRFAVEAKQFMVYYQPIVSTTDCKIIGVEALIRWNHPEKGFISPKDFIPIAEETGLILEIGDWVLRTACTQSKAWMNAGYPIIPMKVNFSTYQFKDANLVELVTNVIQETSMPVQLLDVEISENISMSDSSILILNQLTSLGLQISIDDFGTGFSSLDSLTKFPINTIKIDGSFIKDSTIDVNAQAIIKAIIAMAHSLKMEVVAEGVETDDQLAFLQSLQCDKIQGYLFSCPVSAEEFEKLLENEKKGFSIIQKHSESLV